LHDVHGNVCEWCRDWYHESLPGGTNPETTITATERVLRGGSWHDFDINCRSACRYKFDPGDRSSRIGFRVAAVQTSK
jgi:formylglycine-generating enzyme required for sulfatase activity